MRCHLYPILEMCHRNVYRKLFKVCQRLPAVYKEQFVADFIIFIYMVKETNNTSSYRDLVFSSAL